MKTSSISVEGVVFHYDVIVKDKCKQFIGYTFVSLMADNLRRALQDINFGANDDLVSLPIEVCDGAVRVNKFSLMGMPLIPRKQNLKRIAAPLPRS